MSEDDNVYDPLYGSFVGDQGAWSTAKMCFTAPPNGVAKLHAGPAQPDGRNGGRVRPPDPGDTAASALLLKHEFLDGGADDVTLATLGEVLLEPTLTTLGNFLVRSNSQSSVASASFAVGGFQLEGYAMTLSAFAWNIVRTYTLTPGRRGLQLVGASAGAGSGASAGASMPSFLIRLRRWLSRCAQAVALFTSSSPSVRCTEESSAQSRSLAPFTF